MHEQVRAGQAELFSMIATSADLVKQSQSSNATSPTSWREGKRELRSGKDLHFVGGAYNGASGAN